VAEAREVRSELPTLDVDFMLRGYFFAASQIEDDAAPGGFGGSDNLSSPYEPILYGEHLPLMLVAFPRNEVPFREEYQGMEVILVNTSGEVQAFNAADSRLPIVREALAPEGLEGEGEWQPIEYLPSSFCGNSYHRVFLEPRHQWSFSAPVYDGTVETQMRFALRLESGEMLYSNAFPGLVNPEQFSEKQGHQAASIMDPYLD